MVVDDMNAFLKGHKVLLRDVTQEDLDAIWYWNYEAEDREFQRWNGPYYKVEQPTRERFAEIWSDTLSRAKTEEPRFELVMEIDEELKGVVSRYWVDKVTDWQEIGIVIYDSRFWSGGYGSEAFQMWIDYLFTRLHTVRLGISTWPVTSG